MALTFDALIVAGFQPRVVTFDTPDIFTTGINLGTIPPGASPITIYADVDPLALFNNGVTASLGFSAGGAEWASALALTAAGRRTAIHYAALTLPLTSARPVWLRLQHNGTAPTQGRAVFGAEFA